MPQTAKAIAIKALRCLIEADDDTRLACLMQLALSLGVAPVTLEIMLEQVPKGDCKAADQFNFDYDAATRRITWVD